jgi:predicted CoA-substrate-specific enzyme activase
MMAEPAVGSGVASAGYFLGIDVGSWSTKALLIDGGRRIVGKAMRRSGADLKAAIDECRAEVLVHAGIRPEQVKRVVATGFGRDIVGFADGFRTEISCHARGAFHYFPKQMTVIDIGGQDNKVIRVNHRGKHISFRMNRKCAAGTGAFLEEVALKLSIPLEQFTELSRKATKKLQIGAFCTVFTSTEVLSLVRKGEKKEDIVRGLMASVAARIMEMEPLSGTVVITGGVIAHNPGLRDIFEQDFGLKVDVPPDPQFTGALGAALYALDG